MLNFKAVALEDRAVLEPVLRAQPYRICDHCFACLYIWENTYPAQFCFDEDILYIMYSYPDGSTAYQLPYCPDEQLPGAIEKIRRHAAGCGKALCLVTLNDEQKNKLDLMLPGAFVYDRQPDYADYIYNAQDLITLRGKKFHAKRNFINRFTQQYEGRFLFEPVGPANAGEVLAFNARWDEENQANGIADEADAIRRAVLDLERIGMFGTALRLDGEIAAFALGTRLCGDTVLEQIEKSADLPGGYQMINQAFAQQFAADCLYINREEDLGIEGLRKAKLSYNPAYINMRYRALWAL